MGAKTSRISSHKLLLVDRLFAIINMQQVPRKAKTVFFLGIRELLGGCKNHVQLDGDHYKEEKDE